MNLRSDIHNFIAFSMHFLVQYSDDYWEGEADIQLDGYTRKTFVPHQAAFLKALGTALGISEKELSISEISEYKDDTGKHGVSLKFNLKVAQEALIKEVVSRMTDAKRFDSALEKELEKNKVIKNGNAMRVGAVSMQRIIGKTLMLGLGVGSLTMLCFLSIGAYKLHSLAHRGYTSLDGSSSERADLGSSRL
jgi:hypothetical protein